MMKRIIALLLALILTVGLLPTVALATEGDTPAAGTSNDVKNGYYEGTTWKEGTLNQDTLPTGVESVSKTAKKVEGEENKYEVTLKVVLKQTEENSGKAATVLVLDTSGSMAYCAECGAEGDCVHNYVSVPGTPSENGTYFYKYTNENGQVRFGKANYCDGNHTNPNKKHAAGWFKTNWYEMGHNRQGDALLAKDLYIKKTRASRLDAAKVAAENFLKTYSGLTFNTDGTVAVNQNSRNLGRYVSVVSFADKAKSVQSWVDVLNSDVYQGVLRNIKGLSAEGGTNLDAGLTYAEYLLNDNTVRGAVKNVIALTDGQPTYCLKKNCTDLLHHLFNDELTIGNTTYCVHGDGKQCTDEIYNSTVDTATRVKNVPSKIYTVCFDAGETIDVPNSQKKISVSEYLRTKIATQPKAGEKFAYDASNAEQLYAEFAKITQSIVSGLSTGTVKDTLPPGITSAAFDNGSVKEWKLNEAPFTKNETPNTVDGKQVTTYTYTYTYTVTINPLTVEKTKIDGAYYAPLNGETTLTVKNSKGENVEIHFPIPAGKVTMPSHTVTWKSQDGNTTLETDNNVEYNTKPTFNSDAPTKADDAQYTYTFVGWATEANKETGTLEADLPPVTDDVTYYAAFSKTPRTYTVTWMPQDGQGNAYETDTGVAYNARPSYDSEVPTKAADDKYTYTFAGWATTTNQTSGSTVDALPNVTENVTYYAAFSATPRTYTVTFKDGANGEVFVDETQQVEYGKNIPSHDNPVRPGYNFTGWTSEPANYQPGTGTMPANNITFTARWTEKTSVTISYVAKEGGSVDPDSETLNPDTGVAKGSTAKANDGYRFVGWYSDETCTTAVPAAWVDSDNKLTPGKPEGGWADATYYAKFESLTYTITFETETGGTLTGRTNYTGLAYNADFPDEPEKSANSGYYFDGWYKDGAKVPSLPPKVTENATYTAKWLSYNSINLDLTGKIQKTLYSDVELSNQRFTINVKQTGAEVASATATATVSATTASGTGYTGSAPFQTATDEFKLTFTAPGTYIYSIVEEAPTRSGMTYDVNKYNATGHTMTVVVKEDAAHALSVTRVTVDGTADTDATWLTITNNYVEPKDAQVTNKEVVVTQPEGALKTAVYDFEITSGPTVLYPTGNGTTSNTLEVSYGTTEATLLYKITVYAGTESSYTFEDKDASFVYAENAKTVTKNGDYFTVTFEDGAEYAYVYVAVTHAISYDADGEYKARNFIGSQGAETTVTEKDPNKLTINFADFVKKELTATGSKTANDVKFRVIVNGMESPYMMYNVGEEEVSTYAAFDPKYSTVLNVNFASITGGNTETEWFIADNSIVIDQAGIYYFELNEEDGKRTGVTYDDLIYKVLVYVERKDDKLVVKSFDIMKDNVYVDGDTITFHNTIDTGKDDYYPIIIPTIINKDTGMLNKTDHFAYVIGYPDGTVHPNGQITRAEVATIFFRLLRDEVRDGAFTTSNTYSDVAYGKWYNNPISTMSALGIITGYPDGTFKPNKPITRAEFAAIAARFDETQSGKSATFSDVIGHWAAKEIGIAYYNDWIKGYPDGTFKPDQNITRAEAMTLINRVLERKPESPADLLTNMNKWTDNLDTSKWYYLDVQEATNSHGYTRKTFNYELWRQMLPDPDWSRYER